MKTLKKTPKFISAEAESQFWEAHDSTEYVDWTKAKKVHFAHLKPSTKNISLRLPEMLLNNIKVLANKEDVPYQSLIKLLLSEGVQRMHYRKVG